MAEHAERLPDLPDMLDAGMSLSEAFAFWGEMIGGRDQPAAYWWRALKAERRSSPTLQ